MCALSLCLRTRRCVFLSLNTHQTATDTPHTHPHHSIAIGGGHRPIRRLFPAAAPSSTGLSVLITTDADVTALVHFPLPLGGQPPPPPVVVWEREEALSGVAAVGFVDFVFLQHGAAAAATGGPEEKEVGQGCVCGRVWAVVVPTKHCTLSLSLSHIHPINIYPQTNQQVKLTHPSPQNSPQTPNKPKTTRINEHNPPMINIYSPTNNQVAFTHPSTKNQQTPQPPGEIRPRQGGGPALPGQPPPRGRAHLLVPGQWGGQGPVGEGSGGG